MIASMKLIDLVENKAEEIAKQWAKDVTTNKYTPSYRNIPYEQLIPQAVLFYDHFRKIFMTKDPAAAAKEFFSRYAEERYRAGIPLHEAIYALILMRRHMWLYAEFQAVFMTAVEKQQAVDSITRTILMFDYAMYFISQTYRALMKLEWFEQPNT